MNRILLTGAAGIVGSALRPLLSARFEEVLLTDLSEIETLASNESFTKANLGDLNLLTDLALEVDGIVHLGGLVGADFSFDEVLGANVVGSHHVFEAARRAGGLPVVYASSHHAIGFRQRTDIIDETTAPRPDSFYGLSKAFGEEVGSYYSDRYGMKVLSIRIGFVGSEVIDERRLHTWCSPRDLMQLVEIGLTTPGLGFQIVYGVSEVPEPFFDNRNAERLGYRPKDRAVDHLANPELRHAQPDPEVAEGIYIGGHFCDS